MLFDNCNCQNKVAIIHLLGEENKMNTNEKMNPVTLNPVELIKWCKNRKVTLGLSNAKLSDMSGVPIGTIDRIMSGNYTEFKYSSVQPLISVLIEFGKETPEPNEDSEQEQYYYETIEGYKIIVENKNHEIDHYKTGLARRISEVEYLKQENANKQEMINNLTEHIKWLEKLTEKSSKN